MPPLLAIDQVQMSLQWLSLVSLAYRLLPAHPNQLLSLPAMPPQRLFFWDVFSSRNFQIFCRISDASLVSWRQLLQLSSKAQSLDTKLNDFQWFSIWLHLQPLPRSLGLAHAAKNSFDFSHAIGGGFGRCHRHGCKMVCKRLCPTRETPDDSSCTLQRYARNDLHTCRDVTNCDRTTLRPWGMYKQCIQWPTAIC